MNGKMRFREHHRAGSAPVLGAFMAVELVEMIPNDRKTHVGTRVDAELPQHFGRDQQLALLAVVQVGNDVQSLHFDTPFQAKVRWWGLPRATSGVPQIAGRP